MRNERKRARAPGTSARPHRYAKRCGRGNMNPLFTTPPSPTVSPLHYSATPFEHSLPRYRTSASSVESLGEGGNTNFFADTIIR
jgi:hypothetical protein